MSSGNFKRGQGLYFIALIFSALSLAGCEKALQLEKPAGDPVAIFDEVWAIMDQRYSMFDLKAVDWANNYQLYRSRVHENMTGSELFRVIGEMLGTLKDGHVTLISGSDTATYDNFYKAFATNFNFPVILANYLKNDFSQEGPLIYKITDNTGYLYYNSFERDVTGEELDKVFNDLSATKGLIVDIRSNTGGNSVNADNLFSRFIAETKLVKYNLVKSGPSHTDFFEPKPVYISPAGRSLYNKPVAVLTNRACFSACNDFAFFMSDLPNVRIFGDQTGGGGGIPVNYLLANGWMLQYSATQTLSAAMENMENGILPDFYTGISSIDESNGRDPILEQAFQSLQ